MMKTSILLTTTLTLVSLAISTTSLLANTRPNVVIIMTDDLGYPELSVHGNPVLQTPNLDKLHGQSLRLSDFHVTPMYTPTRGQLLTGIDAVRNGAANVSSGRALLRPEISTMANFFGDAGYATGIFGKWHLGANYPYRPRTGDSSKAFGFHLHRFPRCLLIGGTTTLTMFTQKTVSSKSSKATAPMCFLVKRRRL